MINWLFDKLRKDGRQEAIRLVQDAQKMEEGGNAQAALVLYEKALRLTPYDADLRLRFGDALRASGDNEAAELAYRYVIARLPDETRAYRALGQLLSALNRYPEARDCFQIVLVSKSVIREDWVSAALAAYFSYDFSAAHEYFEQASRLQPLDIPQRFMQGTALVNCGLLNEAEFVLLEASKMAPDEPKLFESIGMVRLLKGEWRSGFELHEYRHATLRRNHPESLGAKWLDYITTITKGIPSWQGEPLKGRRLLLWCEQGFGDCIMMMRLVPELLGKSGCNDLLVIGYVPLERLVESIDGVRHVSVVLGAQLTEDLSGFDYHCSLLSLPCMMRIDYDCVPGNAPWFRLPSALRQAWAEKLAAIPGIKVGLAWAGSPDLQFDSLRSVALARFAPLFETKDVVFISLQQSPDARAELRRGNFPVYDFMDDCKDFMDTAALIAHLDLVISVDTSVVHLAGALNTPVWLLNRFESEWRWLRNKEESAWYPSMRIFNQTTSRDWSGVFEVLPQELRTFLTQKSDRS